MTEFVIKDVFLIFPKWLKNKEGKREFRWLRKAKVQYIYSESRIEHDGLVHFHWRPIKWMN